MRLLPRLLLAVLAGLGLAGAFEPLTLVALLPIAVAGYFLAVRGLSLRRGFLVGWAFGIAFYFTHIYWMRSVGTDAWLALAGVESLFYGALGSALAALERSRLLARWWPLWAAAAWTSMEHIRCSWPFSGMPWGRLAYAVVDTPFAEALPYVGATGVSFGLALLGALLAWLVVGPRRRLGMPALLGVALLAAVFVAPVVRPWQPDVTGHLDVAAVQGDVPGPGNDVLWDHRQVTRNHAEATEQLARDVAAGTATRPDLVLWPENSTAVDPFRDARDHAAIVDAVHAIDVPVLVGGMVDGGPSHVYNQGIVWDPVTGPGERYTKHHPVPFGEYIPFRDVIDGWNFGRLTVIGRDMVAGTDKEPLTVAGVKIADSICFDVAYDDVLYDQVARGAQLVTVQTSNAMFIFTHQIEQQFAITRLRAIETGRYVVVASTNGRSGVIAPDGSVIATARPRTTSVLAEQVGLVSGVTPAVRLGPWPGRMILAVTIVALLVTAVTRVRRRTVATVADHVPPVPATAPSGEPDEEKSLT